MWHSLYRVNHASGIKTMIFWRLYRVNLASGIKTMLFRVSSPNFFMQKTAVCGWTPALPPTGGLRRAGLMTPPEASI